MKTPALVLLFSIILNQLIAISPDPPVGKRWVINKTTSDEFSGNSLDASKWDNTSSRWIGRSPGLFKKESMTVADGAMRLTQDKLEEISIQKGDTFTHRGGHIISTKKVQPGAYIESSMKANKTFMSSTFWLINYSNESSGCQRRTTELDVQEVVGYSTKGDLSKTTQMGSNTHSRGIPTDCSVPAGSKGAHTELGGFGYDRFYTYAVWWKSESELLFYLDNEYKYTISPVAPFNIDMYIKMVTETYDWNPVPTGGGMDMPWEDRTTYYDFTRTYNLVNVDASTSLNSGYDEIFTEEVKFFEKLERYNNSDVLDLSGVFKANQEREMHLEIYNEDELIAKKVFSALRGHGHKAMAINVEGLLQEGVTYKAILTLRNKAESSSNPISSDEFTFTISNPVNVSFAITDERTKTPIATAQVVFNGSEKQSDAEGKVIFENIPLSKYEILLSANGYKSLTLQDVQVLKDTLIYIELDPILYRVNPVVTDSVTGEFIKSVKVMVDGVQRTTNSAGETSFNLYSGSYPVLLIHADYRTKTDTMHVTQSGDIALNMFRAFTKVEFEVKLDGSFLSQADIVVGNDAGLTSVLGKYAFNNVETNTVYDYSISKNNKQWYRDKASFYNDTIIQIALMSTGTKSIEAKTLELYPNPAKQNLSISGLTKATNYGIFTINGIEIQVGTWTPGSSINIGNLPKGIYYLKLQGHANATFSKY